jgi:hypothetical protein
MIKSRTADKMAADSGHVHCANSKGEEVTRGDEEEKRNKIPRKIYTKAENHRIVPGVAGIFWYFSH